MTKLITLFTFIFVALSFGQEKQISESELVGYWTSERIINENDYSITVYRRSNIGQEGTTIRFMTNGEYRITHNLGIGRGRCGNEVHPKKIIGYFRLDQELQKIILYSYSTAPSTNWDVLWIDENSLGIKKPKHNKT